MTDVTATRPLDPGEAFFFMSDRVSCMNFIIFAERAGHLDPQRIRDALALIQQENLLLRSRITWTDTAGLCFEEVTCPPVPLECHVETAESWQAHIEQALSRHFDTEAPPLMRCLYLEIAEPARCVLAVYFHHSIADGRSGNELIRRLLDLIARDPAKSRSQPADTVPLSLPPMHARFPEKFNWPTQPAAAIALKEQMISSFQRHGALTSHAWLDRTSTTRTPRLIRLALPKALTAKLLMRCKAEGTSVHGALCAAQLLAHQRQSTTNATSATDAINQVLSCPVDMRPHLAEPMPTSPLALHISLLTAPYAIDAQTPFWPLAQQVISDTRSKLARGDAHLFFSLYRLDQGPITPDRFERFAKAQQGVMQNTMISNVGQVATVDSDPQVETISFAVCPTPYQTIFTAATTYNGQLLLTVGYDEGKLSSGTAQALVASIRELLAEATS